MNITGGFQVGEKHKKECKGGEDCSDEKHLCKIAGKKDFNRVRDIVREARYFCMKCGRAAHNNVNLCKPAEI